MGDIGVPGLLIILVIALIIIGPGKIPEVGEALGRGIREFRRATDLSGEAKPVTPAPARPETPDETIARLTRERDALNAELLSSQAGASTSDRGASVS
ncbi:MAG: twin-arginine translocase TatA/TatE family subunit [Chloroflexota bacterium]